MSSRARRSRGQANVPFAAAAESHSNYRARVPTEPARSDRQRLRRPGPGPPRRAGVDRTAPPGSRCTGEGPRDLSPPAAHGQQPPPVIARPRCVRARSPMIRTPASRRSSKGQTLQLCRRATKHVTSTSEARIVVMGATGECRQQAMPACWDFSGWNWAPTTGPSRPGWERRRRNRRYRARLIGQRLGW